MMTEFYNTPGVFTDMLNPFDYNRLDWPFIVDCGFEWATFQCYNPQLGYIDKEYDLAAVKAHGFKNVGLWAGVYDKSDFYHSGKQMAINALHMGADHIIFNIEYPMMYTRETQMAKPIVQGAKDNGWDKAISLCTLGAPWTPAVNDYGMDTKTFTDSGGCVITETYPNESEGYDLEPNKLYWSRVGVPTPKLTYLLGMYPGALGKVSGTAYTQQMKDNKVGKNYSLYMAQHATKEDYEAFKAYNAIVVIPAPLPAPDPALALRDHARSELEEAIEIWKKQGKSDTVIHNTRVYQAWRVLDPTSDLVKRVAALS